MSYEDEYLHMEGWDWKHKFGWAMYGEPLKPCPCCGEDRWEVWVAENAGRLITKIHKDGAESHPDWQEEVIVIAFCKGCKLTMKSDRLIFEKEDAVKNLIQKLNRRPEDTRIKRKICKKK